MALSEELKESFEDFFKNYAHHETGELTYRAEAAQMGLYERRSMSVDVDDLLSWGDGSLGLALIDDPEGVMLSADAALRELLQVEMGDYEQEVSAKMHDRKRRKRLFRVRFTNLPDVCRARVGDLLAEHVQRLISLVAIVSRLSDARPSIALAVFRCKACNYEQSIIQEGQTYRRPTRCPEIDCPTKKGPFKLLEDECEYEDCQWGRLQDLPEALRPGEVAQHLPVVLWGDLVRSARMGAHVRVVGILRARPKSGLSGVSCQFPLHLEVHSVEELDATDLSESWTPAELEQFQLLSKRPRLLEELCESLAPGLFGLSDPKTGIILSLFGGVTTGATGSDRHRGDIHVLMVGDPGVGKSHLLHGASLLAPRSIMTSGKGTSTAGLTAAAIPESGRGFRLEPGALVLASGGLVCIDELDKMTPDDLSALHQALESGEVSVTKASICQTLPAQTTVIAAANPRWGRFDRDKVPSENIRLPPALLSRFDLIFLMLDEPEPERDLRVIQQLKARAGTIGTARPVAPLDPRLVRRYIRYARNRVAPQLGSEAAESIESRYLHLRSLGQSPESPTSVTPRQGAAVIRLAQARARVELRSVVELADVDCAWGLLEGSLRGLGQSSDSGAWDIDAIMTGQPLGGRQLADAVMSLIRRLLAPGAHYVAMPTLVESARATGITSSQVDQAVSTLIGQNCLYRHREHEGNLGICD